MNEEICVGRKEIICFFKELKLIGNGLKNEDAWRTILDHRKKYRMEKLFHRLHNGKPKIIKREIENYLQKIDYKSMLK